MNIYQQKYKRNRLLGMNQYNAARAAGYSETTSRTHSDRIERAIKGDLRDAFEQAGLTDKAIVAHALSGLNALKLQSCNIYVSKPNAESVDADKLIINKNSDDFVEIEDWNARHKYFETILKLTERLMDKVLHSGHVGGGEARIYIINGAKEDNGRSISNAQRLPEKISI